MMRRLLFALAILLAMPALASADQAARGWCETGGQLVITSGLNSTTNVQASYPQCIVTVAIHGAGTAAIFKDNAGTVLTNPFLAQSNGQWQFYAANGRYDITLSGAGFPTPVTYSDVSLSDPAQQSTVQCALISTASPLFNAGTCSIFSMTLTSNASATVTGAIAGQEIIVSLTQGVGGPFAFTWPSNFLNPPTLTSIVGASAQFTFVLLADGNWHHTGTGESQVFNTNQNGNQLIIGGNTVTGATGSGANVVLQTSPTVNGATLNSGTLNGTFAGNPSLSGNLTVGGTFLANGPGIFKGPNPWVDVIAFGAACNAVTDDSAALQAAINFAVLVGGTLHLPPTVCRFATGLTTTSALSIQGSQVIGGTSTSPLPPGCIAGACGGPVSTLYYTGTGTALSISNGTSYIFGPNLSNFQILGNSTNSGIGLACTYCNQVTLANVNVASVNNPGFVTAYDFSNSAGIFATNLNDSNSVNAVKLVNVVNADIAACNFFANQVVFLMGGNQIGIVVHDCINIEEENYIVDWDDTNPVATNTSGIQISFLNNYFLLGGAPATYPTPQVLHISNTSTNRISLQNIVFENNTIYCGSGCPGYAFNVAISPTATFPSVGITAEKNWLYYYASGGITANNSGVTVAWINNTNLNSASTPNTDTNGTGNFCVVQYVNATANLCSVTTTTITASGLITATGGMTASAPVTAPKFNLGRFVVNQGTTVTPANFALSGWGSGATLAVNNNAEDALGGFTVTTGTSPSANPTIVFTYANGAYTLIGQCVVSRGEGASPTTAFWTSNLNTLTTTTFNFVGTPVGGTNYTMNWICGGH